jgi:hypothetical protein
VPVVGSQIRIVPSWRLAEASQELSGATANARTPVVWPVSAWWVVPVVGSQIRISPSSPAEASQDPSGATTNTRSMKVSSMGVRLVKVWPAVPVAGSQSRTSPSRSTEASQDPPVEPGCQPFGV